jgi:FkbM family methyltransferase
MNLRSLKRQIEALAHLKSWKLASVARRMPVGIRELDATENGLRISSISLELKLPEELWFCHSYSYVKSLKTVCAQFARSADNSIQCQIGKECFHVQTIEELFILKEIFVEQDYAFHLCKGMGPENCLILDIGGNVGFSTIYFASLGFEVTSFEPFRPTYAEALRNFALNPHLSHLIQFHNYGLGDGDAELLVDYNPDSRGINTTLSAAVNASANTRKEPITIRDASAVLRDVLAEHGDRRIIVKMDCEGAESAILKNLAKSRLLEKIGAIMMEWHVMDDVEPPAKVMARLSEAGFIVFAPHQIDVVRGMAYAINSRGL